MDKKTTDLEELLKHASRDKLGKIVDSVIAPEFVSEFERLLESRNLSRSNLIQKTLLDRNYAYQIMQGKRQGSKDKIVQLSLALSCTLEETNRLLTLSENPKLYAKNKRDMYLIYAIENKMSVMDTNELLDQHDEPLLN